jgi:hypothetical protein
MFNLYRTSHDKYRCRIAHAEGFFFFLFFVAYFVFDFNFLARGLSMCHALPADAAPVHPWAALNMLQQYGP